MPLHGQNFMSRLRAFYRFNHLVFRAARDHAESIAGRFGCLVMGRVHRKPCVCRHADLTRETRVWFYDYLMGKLIATPTAVSHG